MADRIPQELQTVDSTIYSLLEATVSTNDTVTINGIDSITRAVIGQKLASTDVSCTTSGNTITITQASLTNEDVVILVWE